ncbi:hypothetical protein [Necropsobacter massiliensis]|uniref:hypothetical protein n=1 Tax=Necropsobacter massiliensis TaxID=1400001 RepID=UPI000595BA32|nr:hypothetical protein [Necropsobacter massiliensis]
MKDRVLNNPHNLFGKLAALTPLRQNLWLSLLGLLLIAFPLSGYVQQSRLLRQLEQELHDKNQQLTHQQNLFTVLQQQSVQQPLDQRLTAALPAINRQVRQLLPTELHLLVSDWEFSRNPLLHLQLEGHFADFNRFMTALLTANRQLNVVSLQINRVDNDQHTASIRIELLLRLHFA